jgi:molybdate transport system substrate-binding protein
LGLSVLLLCLGAATATVRAQRDVVVFAAVSLKGALDDVAITVKQRTGLGIRPSYAGTPLLARQIEEGAPADIFLAADEQWMDYLAERKLVVPASRVNLVGNRLVLIAPRESRVQLPIEPGFPLGRALGSGRLAIADPVNVPAGRYGKAALTRLGVWDSVAGRLAQADNVRAALSFVARGEVPLGIVYQSDVAAEPNVRVVAVFPADTHPPIVYPAALTTRATRDARRVLDAIVSAEARAVFQRHGFPPPPRAGTQRPAAAGTESPRATPARRSTV